MGWVNGVGPSVADAVCYALAGIFPDELELPGVEIFFPSQDTGPTPGLKILKRRPSAALNAQAD